MSTGDKLKSGVVTSSAEAAHEIAAAFAPEVPVDQVLALHGNLGAGKTTFVQGLARGFGLSQKITSPTFQLYALHSGGQRQLLHLDAYRLERPEQVDALLLEDFLQTPWCAAVEWPEKIAGWLPQNTWHLYFDLISPGRHSIQWREPAELPTR